MADPELAPRQGMPPQSSVVEVTVLRPNRTPAAAALAPVIGPAYRILRTKEFDPKDKVRQIASLGMAPAHVGNNFEGTARKAAKLSISGRRAKIRLCQRAHRHPAQEGQDEVNHQPPITVKATSRRVTEENRNVRLRAFLYAASREDDNDFHLIIGEDVTADPPVDMTAKYRGCPRSTPPASPG